MKQEKGSCTDGRMDGQKMDGKEEQNTESLRGTELLPRDDVGCKGRGPEGQLRLARVRVIDSLLSQLWTPLRWALPFVGSLKE